MSTVRIKMHYGKGGYLPLGKCAQPNCGREADEIVNGKVFCSRHLTVTLATAQPRNLRPGQGFGR